jgi:serine/threonine-protein kinase
MDPRAGTAVPMPGIVVLTVSAGPPKVVTPGVLNVTIDQAEARLQTAGLRLGKVTYDPASTAPLGDVVAQSPEPGDSIRMGGAVRITISGSDPNPAPPVDSAAASADSAAPPAQQGTEPAPAPPAP